MNSLTHFLKNAGDAHIDAHVDADADAENRRTFSAIAALLKKSPGYRLFSILVVDLESGVNRRIYSSNPRDYPLGGVKSIDKENAFYRDVVVGGEPRLCTNRDECRAAFYDHELIFSLGCECAINMPIQWRGVTLGSLNILDAQNAYSADSIEAMRIPTAMAVPAVLKFLNQESQ